MRIDDDIPSDLPDPARIQRMEASLALQKQLLMIFAAITIILLTSFVTGALMLQGRLKQPVVHDPANTVVSEERVEVRKRLAAIEKQLAESQDKLTDLTNAVERKQIIEQTGQVQKMNQTLQEQEQTWRAFVRALKDGMFDLSRMVAGSRTWLDEYNDRLDRVLASSVAREQQLQEMHRLADAPESAEKMSGNTSN